MIPMLKYRLVLLKEVVDISIQMLLIRLRLKRVTLDERYDLKERSFQIRLLIAQLEKDYG
jgi:hypothetical protein